MAERAFERGLCAECFGRLVGRYGHGLTNPERAELLAVAVGRPLPRLTQPCHLCEGSFDRWDVWLARVVPATEGWGPARFNCGSRWDPERLAREEALWAEFGTAWGETARSGVQPGAREARGEGRRNRGGDEPDNWYCWRTSPPAGSRLRSFRSTSVVGTSRRIGRSPRRGGRAAVAKAAGAISAARYGKNLRVKRRGGRGGPVPRRLGRRREPVPWHGSGGHQRANARHGPPVRARDPPAPPSNPRSGLARDGSEPYRHRARGGPGARLVRRRRGRPD